MLTIRLADSRITVHQPRGGMLIYAAVLNSYADWVQCRSQQGVVGYRKKKSEDVDLPGSIATKS